MTRYLLDTNIYIDFYDRYYRFAHFPSFWEALKTVLNTQVVIPKVVIDENCQNQAFRDWLKNSCYTGEYLNHKDYANEWSEVIQHIAQCGNYNDAALTNDGSWTDERIADGWLVAIAKKNGLTLVSSEKGNYNLNRNQPSKSVKIPDIANDLSVRCIDMNIFFAEIGLKI